MPASLMKFRICYKLPFQKVIAMSIKWNFDYVYISYALAWNMCLNINGWMDGWMDGLIDWLIALRQINNKNIVGQDITNVCKNANMTITQLLIGHISRITSAHKATSVIE